MTTQTKHLRKATFKHIESEIYGYHDTQREIIRMKNEILHGSGGAGDENTGGGRSSLPGDPTGRVATLLADHRKIDQLQKIVDAIEAVVAILPAPERQLVKLKYWTRPQALTWDGIAQQIGVSRRQALRWRDEIVQAISERVGWR